MRKDTIDAVPEGTSCYIDVKAPDDRFKCSCCGKGIAEHYREPLMGIKMQNIHKMFVDTHQNIYCQECYRTCLDWTVRSVKRNPDENRPRMIHQSGNYYQLMKREKAL